MLFLQILLKEYNFDNRHKPTFTEEDILNIFPVVKHVNPKASDAFHFFQSGQAKVQQGTDPACLCLLRLLLINYCRPHVAHSTCVASPVALGVIYYVCVDEYVFFQVS